MVRVDRKLKQDPFYEGVFEVVKFVKEKAEYQLARMGEREVRVRTRHENLKRASGSEVKGEGRYEVTRVKDMREEQGVRIRIGPLLGDHQDTEAENKQNKQEGTKELC